MFSFQRFCAVAVWGYYHTAYRIRAWGRIDYHPGPTLLVTNHQHDLDTTGALMHLSFMIPANQTIYSAGSRRMFETGFMAMRFKWMEGLIRRFDSTKLFSALGVFPIENELRTRDMASFAAWAYLNHGDLAITDLFDNEALGQLRERAAGKPLSWLFSGEAFRVSHDARVRLKFLKEPYQSELIADVRSHVKPDLERIVAKFREGVTFYLTAEGRYSIDGRLNRFRETFDRLAPIAERIYLIAISYDVYASRRFSMLIRFGLPRDPNDLRSSLKAMRAVTVSQLLCAWLLPRTQPWTQDEAIAGVTASLARVDPAAFIDPELARDPERMTRATIAEMTRLRTLVLDSGRYRLTQQRKHPQFALVDDMVAFQATFFGETTEGLAALGKVRAAG